MRPFEAMEPQEGTGLEVKTLRCQATRRDSHTGNKLAGRGILLNAPMLFLRAALGLWWAFENSHQSNEAC